MLFDRRFGTLFWGKLIASVGVWVHIIVAAIVAFDATGSALVVAAVSMLQFAPQLLFAPLSGGFADRGHGATQLILGRLLCILGSGGLAVWLWLVPAGEGLVGAAPVMAASLVVGIGFATGGPVLQSIIPDLVAPEALRVAMALNTVPMIAARAAGPALGAVLVTQLDAKAAFAVAAGTHACFLLLLVLTRLPSGGSVAEGVDTSVRHALGYVRRDRPVLLLLLGIGAVGFGSEPITTLAPSLAASLEGPPGLVGWLASAFGLGAALGLVVLAVLRSALVVVRQGAAGLMLMATGHVVAALSPHQAGALAGFGLCGLGLTLAMTGVSTLLQERVPAVLRGRVMALWLVGFLGSRPLAAAVAGALADYVSVEAALLATAAVVVVIAWLNRPALVAPPFESRPRRSPRGQETEPRPFTDD